MTGPVSLRTIDPVLVVALTALLTWGSMRHRVLAIGLTGCLAAGLAQPLFMQVAAGQSSGGQSLGDLARQEEARRKAVKAHAKVITNKDLGGVPEETPSPVPATAAPKPADSDKDADKAKDPNAAAKDPVKDPAYWAERRKGLQTELDRDQSYLSALQSQINALTTDFANRDDPAQRGVIERERQKAVAEFNRLKKAIVTDRKAIVDFEEEARRAGVPPGWLR